MQFDGKFFLNLSLMCDKWCSLLGHLLLEGTIRPLLHKVNPKQNLREREPDSCDAQPSEKRGGQKLENLISKHSLKCCSWYHYSQSKTVL